MKKRANSLGRDKKGMLCGIIGMLCNIFLSAAKITCGAIFNSIAILADGLNNLSDAGSSLISVVSFKLAGRPADKEHPFGHARYEYVAALAVALIVMLMGVEVIKTAIDKLISPDHFEVSVIVLAVLGASIAVKIGMFVFYRIAAKKLDSVTLKAAAIDSISDVAATTVILIGALISKFTNVYLDGYLGIAVALFILWTALKMIKETVNPLIGQPPPKDMVREIERKIKEYAGVLGIHDLMVHNYGPKKFYASVHVEVDAKKDVMESHEMIDEIEKEFRKKNLELVIHMDPVVTDDIRISQLKQLIQTILCEINERLSFHDFRVVFGPSRSNLIFDVVIPYGLKLSHEQIRQNVNEKLQRKHANLQAVIEFDDAYTESN